MSSAILALYIWSRFIPTGEAIPIGLVISDYAAATAAILSVSSLILCLWLPKKNIKLTASIVYIAIIIQITVLISTSGGLSSPFISTWLLVAIFAGYFGILISSGMIALLVLQIVIANLQFGTDTSDTIIHLIFGLAPMALSFVLWHRQPSKNSDKSLHDLASKLSSVEGKSDLVINAIGDGVMAINSQGVIDLINPSAQTLVGWNKGDALGLDWRSVFKLVTADGKEVLDINNPISQSLANNEPAHSDKLYLPSQAGKKRLLSIVSSPVGKSSDGVIVVFRDISKEKEEEREQAEFISTASHEMRTPVASIEGYLGLALNPATANIDEKARDFITKAHESARYLGRLFQDLLDISKAEEGLLKNNPQVVDIATATENIFEGLSNMAAEKGLRYIYKPNPSLEDDKASERRLEPVFYAYIDPHHFREVVSNLIENAIKYTSKGDVTVDIAGDSETVRVIIQDTGIGIPAEDIPHLFQKFYRVDNSDTREIGGTGLGLFLCRRLAEIMGGNLRLESTYRQGSTFFFELPRMGHSEAMQKLQELPDDQPQIVPNRTSIPISSFTQGPLPYDNSQQPNLNQATPDSRTLSHTQKLQPITTTNFSPITPAQLNAQDLEPKPTQPQETNLDQTQQPAQPYTAMTIEQIEANYRATPRQPAANTVNQGAHSAPPQHPQPPYVSRQYPIPNPHHNSQVHIPPRNIN